jgi:sugar O-acyltransferase (sialic acid O-acetyltransferase NeuD family)
VQKKIVIIGSGETALLAYEYFTHDSKFQVAGFSVESAYLKEKTCYELPVVPFEEITSHFPPVEFDAFVAMSSTQLNRVRTRFYSKAKELGYKLVSYVSSHAFVWHNVEIGENCFILEDNTLQPFTKVGNNVVLWSGNHIGHRTVIKDNVFIASQVVISGFCEIGEFSFVGVNATFANDIKVAPDNFIALGAVINKHTEPDKIYTGNPAEPAKIGAKRFNKVKE